MHACMPSKLIANFGIICNLTTHFADMHAAKARAVGMRLIIIYIYHLMHGVSNPYTAALLEGCT